MDIFAFTPIGDTVNITAATSTGRVQITDSSAGSSNIRIHNKGTEPVWIKFGDSTVTAVLGTSIPVPVGAIEIFGIGNSKYVAAITSSGTSALYATPGQGA